MGELKSRQANSQTNANGTRSYKVTEVCYAGIYIRVPLIALEYVMITHGKYIELIGDREFHFE